MRRDEVLRLITAHEPFDPEEARDRDRIIAALTATDPAVDLFDKRHTAPGHFTASAVVTCPERTHLLLIHHPAFGIWIQPGGHTDPGDASLADASARELVEATGLASPTARSLGLVDVAVHSVPDGIKGQPAHLHFDFRFAFEVPRDAVLGGELETPARWFALASMETVDTDASVRAAARRLARFPVAPSETYCSASSGVQVPARP